jgi:signal transduction histidine kinase
VLCLALYFALFGSVVAVIYGVGLLLVPLVLATIRGFAGIERELARTLLAVDIPVGERVRHQPGLVVKVRRLVASAGTWRVVGWLGARVLLGAATLATVFFGTAAFVGLVWATDWNVLTALPLLALVAAVVVLTLVLLDLIVRLAAAVAPRLLGAGAEQQIAALQQSSRRLADRNRLARDLHDTIGHALTASLLQATAARRTLQPVDDRPLQADFARQALGHIETNTRAALAELDRVLTVLRAEDGGHDPAPFAPPSLDDLEDLLAGLRDGGLPVALVMDGHVEDVPAGVQELAYRVVQEGTTNVLRHAGTPLTVAQVVRSGDTLVVRVCNERASQLDSRPGPGGGRGLAGLRERTAAAGGTLAAEPTPSGGFELCVTLPLSGAA